MSGSLLFDFASAVAKGRGCAMHRTTAGMDLCHATPDPFGLSYPFASMRHIEIKHHRLMPLMRYISNCK